MSFSRATVVDISEKLVLLNNNAEVKFRHPTSGKYIPVICQVRYTLFPCDHSHGLFIKKK